MKFKIVILMVSCLFSMSVWSWDFGDDVLMSRDARELSLQQNEVRLREQNFIGSLTKKIEVLERQVKKQNEVIATYEKLVASLKTELEKEKKNGN